MKSTAEETGVERLSYVSTMCLNTIQYYHMFTHYIIDIVKSPITRHDGYWWITTSTADTWYMPRERKEKPREWRPTQFHCSSPTISPPLHSHITHHPHRALSGAFFTTHLKNSACKSLNLPCNSWITNLTNMTARNKPRKYRRSKSLFMFYWRATTKHQILQFCHGILYSCYQWLAQIHSKDLSWCYVVVIAFRLIDIKWHSGLHCARSLGRSHMCVQHFSKEHIFRSAGIERNRYLEHIAMF